MPKLHAGHVELAVVQLLGYRENTIVPNVSWGLGLRHECDLLALDKKNRFTEIEIKVTLSDLKADFKKGHGHKCAFISRLVYALPMELVEKSKDIIPRHAGIIGVVVRPLSSDPTSPKSKIGYAKAEWIRRCVHNKNANPDHRVIKTFMHLGCMRIWRLKRHNNKTIDL